MKLSPMTLAYGGAALALLLAGAYVAKKGVGGAAAAAAGAVVDAATGAAAELVERAGEAVGIPRTDADKCAAAMATGDTWNASFDCPARTFLAETWRRVTASEGRPASPPNASATPAGDLTSTTGGYDGGVVIM